jgi:hypothetical protein
LRLAKHIRVIKKKSLSIQGFFSGHYHYFLLCQRMLNLDATIHDNRFIILF